MAVAQVILTGSALRGVHADGPLYAAAVAALPQVVKLGRIRPKARPNALRFGAYFDASASTPPPVSINRRDKAALSIARMYLNDTYGDCVVAGKGHAFGVWSANQPGSAGVIVGTDQEIYQQYQKWCGPGDNGCNITDVLDAIKAKGMVLGGKTYSIEGYVACDWTNRLETQVVQYLYGAGTIGINLPEAWTQNAVWDVTNTGDVGGHDVTPIDYDEKGVYVASWGRIYLITWAAWRSRTWLEEYYAILSPTWYDAGGTSGSGVDRATLSADLAKLGAGTIPPIDPTPVPPIVPPVVPPVTPQVVVIPDRTVHAPIFGGPMTLPGGTYPVTIAKAAGCDGCSEPKSPGAGVTSIHWLRLFFDLRQLVTDAGAAGTEVYLGAIKVYADIRAGQWANVVADVASLIAAAQSLNNPAVVADLKAIAADLGIAV